MHIYTHVEISRDTVPEVAFQLLTFSLQSFMDPHWLWPDQRLKQTMVQCRPALTFEKAQAPATPHHVSWLLRPGLSFGSWSTWLGVGRDAWANQNFYTHLPLPNDGKCGGQARFCQYWVGGNLGGETILPDESVEIEAGYLVLMKIKSLLSCLLERFSRYALW